MGRKICEGILRSLGISYIVKIKVQLEKLKKKKCLIKVRSVSNSHKSAQHDTRYQSVLTIMASKMMMMMITLIITKLIMQMMVVIMITMIMVIQSTKEDINQ